MRLKRLSILTVVGAAVALAQSNIIDVFTTKVRGERTAEFDTMVRKIADANRRAKDKGDYWIAYEEMYGEVGNVYMVSPRENMGAIEPAMGKFMGAVTEYLGMAPERFAAEWNRNTLSSRAELFRRRWDLSWNVPQNPGDMMKESAHAKYAQVVMLSVKPGHTLDCEKQLQTLKEAAERADVKATAYVNISIAGSGGTSVSVVSFAENLGEFDQRPSAAKLLGTAYTDFQRATAENLERVEFKIMVARPEWSNVPKMIADANPSFWNVKPPAAKAKPAAAKPEPAKSGM